MRMLLRGLKYLHDISIMHRDIKPANLLITDGGTLKIADFGLARIYRKNAPEKSYSPQVATRFYRAPEILWGASQYGPAIDLWAAGCVFAEMLRGIPLFGGTTDIEQLALVVRLLGTPDTEQWPELLTLADYNKIRFVFLRRGFQRSGAGWDSNQNAIIRGLPCDHKLKIDFPPGHPFFGPFLLLINTWTSHSQEWTLERWSTMRQRE